MPKTVVRENESLDEALRLLNVRLIKPVSFRNKKRQYYVKPGLRRKLKAEQARRKARRG